MSSLGSENGVRSAVALTGACFTLLGSRAVGETRLLTTGDRSESVENCGTSGSKSVGDVPIRVESWDPQGGPSTLLGCSARVS